MRALLILITLAVGLLAVPSPSGAQQSGLTDVRDLPRAITAATGAGNSAAIAALYAPEARLIPPDAPPVVGRDNIRAVFASNHAMGRNVIHIDNVQMDGDNQRAIVLMDWNFQILPPGKPEIRVRGRSLLYLRNSAAGWHIIVDMFQKPPPG